uniref:AlNc14C535G12084 protein n=1 Tax=Albugo laibachii Nc14 TaxID=890382 RepID=F0X0Z7_9STRA|nr:AlNc14C535G12084 [Albugo laibachii Nc14]|eukprot:CCA27443.1 AlNc14C535G12084 [Albugo laibachii Nc14]
MSKVSRDGGIDDDTYSIRKLEFVGKERVSDTFCIAMLTDVYLISVAPLIVVFLNFDLTTLQKSCSLQAEKYKVTNMPSTSPLQPIPLKAISAILGFSDRIPAGFFRKPKLMINADKLFHMTQATAIDHRIRRLGQSSEN